MSFCVRRLVYSALLVALSVVFTRFLGFMPHPGLRLSFGEIPIILAGLLFGPATGAAVGASADLVGFALNPMGGSYWPPLTITAALTGALPALFLGRRRLPPYPWARLLGAVALSDLVVRVTLNTAIIAMYLGRPLAALFPMRVVASAILVVIYTSSIKAITDRYLTVRRVHAA